MKKVNLNLLVLAYKKNKVFLNASQTKAHKINLTFLKNYMYLFRNAYIRNYDLITIKISK